MGQYIRSIAIKTRKIFVAFLVLQLLITFSLALFASEVIPRSNWSLWYADSEELAGENGAAVNAFDGKANTIWHTQWKGSNPPPPHEIQIDLGLTYALEGFRYLPRQDGGVNGRIGQYEFYVSNNGFDWGNPVVTGAFANDASEKTIYFVPKTGRYIRLRALTEVNGNPWTSMAEINVLGTAGGVPNQAPNGVIDSPSGDVAISIGEWVDFAGTGSDPDSNLPLSFLWQFGSGSGIANSNMEDPGLVQFNTPGNFTVTFTVIDALGLSDPTPATRIIAVKSGGSPVIPQSAWNLVYVDSEELVGENGAAVNAFDGKANTIWHTQWLGSSPPPQHEIQIDLGQSFAIDGFSYLPRQDGGVNGRIGQYEFYVSNDGLDWGNPVANGTFANDASKKTVYFVPKTGRFIRLRALTEVNGNPWTSMAEINVLGTSGGFPNQAPNGVIDSPSGDVTISIGEWVDFAGTGSDPDSNLPLSFLWQFGSGSGIPNSTMEYPGLVQFNTPGNFTVIFTVTDALGLSDPTPPTRIIKVQSGSSEELVPDWTSVKYAPLNPFVPTYITNPVLTAGDVTDVSAQFVADPFLFHENGNWYMFFEVLNKTSGHGDIGLATSIDGFQWTYKCIVLDENFNISYPYILKYNGKYYMIPESFERNEVRLYEATNFPYGWRFVSTLVSGKDFIDPSIIYYKGTYWMFVSTTNERNCYLYYSDDLASGWIEHPMSPIVTGGNGKARPGGRSLVLDNDLIYRFAQDSTRVMAFEVDILTENQYAEHEVPESPILERSGTGWNSSGMHHIDPWWIGNQWLCAVDGGDTDIIWSIGIYVSYAPWSLWYADSEELVGENGAAVNAFDGKANTIWHTQWLGSSPPTPHEIQIDLGQSFAIDGFSYLPRQDGGVNGRIGQYEFYVSNDGLDWGNPVANGTFANDASKKTVYFVPKTGRFIRLRALTEVNGNPWTSMAEIKIFGAPLPDG